MKAERIGIIQRSLPNHVSPVDQFLSFAVALENSLMKYMMQLMNVNNGMKYLVQSLTANGIFS
jgi:hypothetical protein